MTAIDYAAHVEADTRRLVLLAGSTELTARVPSCPDWTLADLVWHLTEVQGFWVQIVEGLLDDPAAVADRVRGSDGELVAGLAAAGDRLVTALRRADPSSACWTWSDDHSVGFVLRRQAHEALIHRVDAELTAGVPSAGDPELAADGVDEILSVMMGGIPDWADFHTSGQAALLVAEDAGRSWAMEIGRMVGTSPSSGTDYDLPAIDLRTDVDDPATISGPAFALDRWLWGRAGVGALTVNGDAAAAAALRAIAAEATQ